MDVVEKDGIDGVSKENDVGDGIVMLGSKDTVGVEVSKNVVVVGGGAGLGRVITPGPFPQILPFGQQPFGTQ